MVTPSRVVVLALLLTVGCSVKRPAGYTVRDSAGIRIAENTLPAGTLVQLDSQPVLDIGPADGANSEFVTSPLSVIRLGDGRIVAAGWATTELRIFDSTGHWTQTIGRSGSGPGEFEGLGLLFRDAADGWLTFEPGSLRVQRWNAAAELRSFGYLTLPGGGSGGWISGVFADGSLLVQRSRPEPGMDTELMMHRTVTYLRASSPTGPVDSLFSFLAVPVLRHVQNPDWGYGNPLFAPAPTVRQVGDAIAFTSGDRFEVQRRTPTGKLVMIIRRISEPRPITPSEWERAEADWYADGSADVRRLMLPRLRKASTSRLRPPVSAAYIAANGRTWATFGDALIGEAVNASVFDSLGRWEGDLALPTGFSIAQIDADGVLGTFTDTEGFRHIQFYRFHQR